MRKVIDKKVYDTKTATKIKHYHNGYPCSDFKYMEETLYITSKGAFFLCGEGGAMSKYAESYGNSSGYGHGFEVLTNDEAYKWLERHGFDDEIERYFSGDIEEA